MEMICGFVVVRKPEYASADWIKPRLQIGDKIYRGMCRLPWEDLDQAYYAKYLPLSLLLIWEKLNRDNNDFAGVRLLNDYQEANEVLEFSKNTSEIIAIWSPELEVLRGSARCVVPLGLLGLDCFSLGEWSILLDGVYVRPECFSSAVAQLNEYGLLTSDEDCNELFRQYVELSVTQVVEPLMVDPKHTNVRVYTVLSIAVRMNFGA